MTAFALFWLIRLAVRYGMDDALERNRHWLEGRDSATAHAAGSAVVAEVPSASMTLPGHCEIASQSFVVVADQGSEVRPRVDSLGLQVALFVKHALGDLVSTHRFVEPPGREIGGQDANVEC